MFYAARQEDGSWTGALYVEVTDRIRAHHEGFGETLHPVIDLRQQDGQWVADTPSQEQLRGTMSCSRFQGREALRQAGLFDQADRLIAQGNETMQAAWNEASVWNRTSPFILQMGDAMELTPEQIDDLFVQAANISA